MTNLPDEVRDEVVALARREGEAAGPLLKSVQGLGATLDAHVLSRVPKAIKQPAVHIITVSLTRAYRSAAASRGARWVPALPDWGHKAVAATTGALSGVIPVAGALAELPVSVTVMFAAMLREADANGFDAADEKVRAEVLRIFADASPSLEDDDTELMVLGLKVALATGALETLVARAAARLVVILGPKVASSAMLVVGAGLGASINLAYVSYYQELARIRFRLLRLAQLHGALAVEAAYAEAVRMIESTQRPTVGAPETE